MSGDSRKVPAHSPNPLPHMEDSMAKKIGVLQRKLNDLYDADGDGRTGSVFQVECK